MRNHVFGHIKAACTGLHCPLTDSLDTPECLNKEQRPWWYFAHEQDDLNLRVFRMFEITFSLDVANFISYKICCIVAYSVQAIQCLVLNRLMLTLLALNFKSRVFCLWFWTYPSRKHAYIMLTHLNPLLYSKNGVYRDIDYFSYFCTKT